MLNQEAFPDRIQGRHSPLQATPFSDLVIELNSLLLQEQFPPKGSLQLVRPQARIVVLGDSYYEWSSRNGWKVSCGFNDAVTIEKLENKDL